MNLNDAGRDTRETLHRSAVISKDEVYRYQLERTWANSKEWVLWVMLNPSTADAEKDDATIRTITAFSKLWGFDGLMVGNLFAYRTVDPAELKQAKSYGFDIVGPENDEHLNQMISKASRIILAWGANANVSPARADAVERLVFRRKQAYCLGLTQAGHPRHPLYLPRTTQCELIHDMTAGNR